MTGKATSWGWRFPVEFRSLSGPGLSVSAPNLNCWFGASGELPNPGLVSKRDRVSKFEKGSPIRDTRKASFPHFTFLPSASQFAIMPATRRPYRPHKSPACDRCRRFKRRCTRRALPSRSTPGRFQKEVIWQMMRPYASELIPLYVHHGRAEKQWLTSNVIDTFFFQPCFYVRG